jgi:hypothetical protein
MAEEDKTIVAAADEYEPLTEDNFNNATEVFKKEGETYTKTEKPATFEKELYVKKTSGAAADPPAPAADEGAVKPEGADEGADPGAVKPEGAVVDEGTPVPQSETDKINTAKEAIQDVGKLLGLTPEQLKEAQNTPLLDKGDQGGGRSRTKRKGRKGSRKSRKGAKKGAKKSKKSSQSQNGGRRRSSKNRRKHSRRLKH